LPITKKRKVFLLAVLSIVVSSFLFGLYLGEANSDDYNKTPTVDTYLAVYSTWTHVDDEHGELSLRVDDRIYSYRTGKPVVTFTPLPIEYLRSNPIPKRDLRKDLDKTMVLLAPAAETGIIGGIVMSEATSIPSPYGKLVLIFGTLTGGVVGYWVGHDSSPDFDTQTFRDMLGAVPLWGGIERELRNRYKKELQSSGPDLLFLTDHPEVIKQARRDKYAHVFDYDPLLDKPDTKRNEPAKVPK
jgi:hypothetical protein